MSRQVLLNINLTPNIQQDSNTGNFIIYYEEFPQAVASGLSADEAERNLIFLVEQMWNRREGDLKKYIIENHSNSIHINSPANC